MNEMLNEQLFELYPEWHSHPFRLTNQEMDDPYLVIREFFNWANLPLARICLQEWMLASLRATGNTDFVYLHALVDKLVEACWLIYVDRLA